MKLHEGELNSIFPVADMHQLNLMVRPATNAKL